MIEQVTFEKMWEMHQGMCHYGMGVLADDPCAVCMVYDARGEILKRFFVPSGMCIELDRSVVDGTGRVWLGAPRPAPEEDTD